MQNKLFSLTIMWALIWDTVLIFLCINSKGRNNPNKIKLSCLNILFTLLVSWLIEVSYSQTLFVIP